MNIDNNANCNNDNALVEAMAALHKQLMDQNIQIQRLLQQQQEILQQQQEQQQQQQQQQQLLEHQQQQLQQQQQLLQQQSQPQQTLQQPQQTLQQPQQMLQQPQQTLQQPQQLQHQQQQQPQLQNEFEHLRLDEAAGGAASGGAASSGRTESRRPWGRRNWRRRFFKRQFNAGGLLIARNGSTVCINHHYGAGSEGGYHPYMSSNYHYSYMDDNLPYYHPYAVAGQPSEGFNEPSGGSSVADDPRMDDNN